MFRIRQGLTVTLSYAHPENGADFDDVGVSNGSTAGATTPGRPRRVEAAARGANRIDVSWTAPRDRGGWAITGYRVEASPDGASNWTTVQANTGSATSFRRTRASPRGRRGTTASGRSTRKGAGDHSYHYGHLHTYDRREAIAYASATVAGDGRRPQLAGSLSLATWYRDYEMIWVEYDEPLWQAEDGLPETGAFTVTVNGREVSVERVCRHPFHSWNAVGLVLAERVRQGATVTLSYRVPTSGNDVRALQDGAGNAAASFTDREVVNRSEVADGNAQDPQFAEPPTDPLTVSPETKPERHDGASEFDVEIAFSDALHDFSFRTLKEHAIIACTRHRRSLLGGLQNHRPGTAGDLGGGCERNGGCGHGDVYSR